MQKVIAAEYGIHQVTVSKIQTGKQWRHVTASLMGIGRS